MKLSYLLFAFPRSIWFKESSSFIGGLDRFSMLLALFLCCLQATPLVAKNTSHTMRRVTKQEVKQGLFDLTRQLEQHYLLKEWKKELCGWDAETELSALLKRLEQEPESLCTEQAKTYYLDLILSAGDDHLSLGFTTNYCAKLPFSMTFVEGHYFISHSQDTRLKVGDEVLFMDGQAPLDYAKKIRRIAPKLSHPIEDVFKELIAHREGDKAARCTFLHGSIHALPAKKQISITIRPKGKTHQESHKTYWHFCPPFYFRDPTNPKVFSVVTEERGSKKIGVITLCEFVEDSYGLLKEMYFTIAALRKECDAILLNLTSNGGGDPTTGLFLAHCFNDAPIPIYERIFKTTRDSKRNLVQQKARFKKDLLNYRASLAKDCETIQKGDPSGQNGLSYQEEAWSCWERTLKEFTEFGVNYSELHYEEFERALSKERSFFVGKYPLLPAAKFQHPMPPLYIKVDSFSSSCSEIVTYLLQKESRAKVIGSLTAGATGSVIRKEFSPHWGLKSACITCGLVYFPSVGDRPIIEEYGVIPDFYLRPKLSHMSPERGTLFQESSLCDQEMFRYIEHDLVNRQKQEKHSPSCSNVEGLSSKS